MHLSIYSLPCSQSYTIVSPAVLKPDAPNAAQLSSATPGMSTSTSSLPASSAGQEPYTQYREWQREEGLVYIQIFLETGIPLGAENRIASPRLCGRFC